MRTYFRLWCGFLLGFLICVTSASAGPNCGAGYPWADLIIPELKGQIAVTNVVAFLNDFIAKSVTNSPPPTIRLEMTNEGVVMNSDAGFSPREDGNVGMYFSMRNIRIGCVLDVLAKGCFRRVQYDSDGAVLRKAESEPKKSITPESSRRH